MRRTQNPENVAKFIQAVLENTSDQDYSTIDWDFRVAVHHQKIATIASKALT